MNAPSLSMEKATLVLRVLNGRLAGAEHRLPAGKFIRVGHGFDHDIVLRGEGTSGGSFELHMLDAVATVKVKSGTVLLLGQSLGDGDRAHLPHYIPVSLGEFAFAIGEADSPRWNEAHALLASMAPLPGLDTKAPMDTPPSAAPATLAERLETRLSPLQDWAKQPRDWPKIGVIAGCLLLLLAAIEPAYRLVNAQFNGPAQIQSTLQATGFKNLKVVRDPASGQLAILGTLRTDKELARLKSFTAGAVPDARIDVETTEAHAAAAQEILSAQGIEGSVKPTKVGVLTVQSNFLPFDRQQELMRVLKQDLPAVRSVNFFAGGSGGEQDLQYFFSSGPFGMATYVDGNPSYIVTADGTRWFNGSTVPTGHKIVSMEQGKISFERDGRVDDLIL